MCHPAMTSGRTSSRSTTEEHLVGPHAHPPPFQQRRLHDLVITGSLEAELPPGAEPCRRADRPPRATRMVVVSSVHACPLARNRSRMSRHSSKPPWPGRCRTVRRVDPPRGPCGSVDPLVLVGRGAAGGERYIDDLAHYLAAAGHDVETIHGTPGPRGCGAPRRVPRPALSPSTRRSARRPGRCRTAGARRVSPPGPAPLRRRAHVHPAGGDRRGHRRAGGGVHLSRPPLGWQALRSVGGAACGAVLRRGVDVDAVRRPQRVGGADAVRWTQRPTAVLSPGVRLAEFPAKEGRERAPAGTARGSCSPPMPPPRTRASIWRSPPSPSCASDGVDRRAPARRPRRPHLGVRGAAGRRRAAAVRGGRECSASGVSRSCRPATGTPT